MLSTDTRKNDTLQLDRRMFTPNIAFERAFSDAARRTGRTLQEIGCLEDDALVEALESIRKEGYRIDKEQFDLLRRIRVLQSVDLISHVIEWGKRTVVFCPTLAMAQAGAQGISCRSDGSGFKTRFEYGRVIDFRSPDEDVLKSFLDGEIGRLFVVNDDEHDVIPFTVAIDLYFDPSPERDIYVRRKIELSVLNQPPLPARPSSSRPFARKPTVYSYYSFKEWADDDIAAR